MRILIRLLILCMVIGLLVFYYPGLNRSAPVKPGIEQKCPNLSAIFNGRCTQYVDQFGNAARAAFDASGKRIGVQVGRYSHDAPNGMVVEMTYLEPDADHPLGRAFDDAGDPMPLHTGPDKPIARTQRGPLGS